MVFEKEKDPSKLRAPSAGKLVNTLVDDGGHVDKGQPYAEIEVSRPRRRRLDRAKDVTLKCSFLS